MSLGALSLAWTQAEASLPLGWEIVSLTLNGINGTDHPRDAGRWWEAAASDGEVERGEFGYGATPHQALRRLAEKLREIRGSTTGGGVVTE